MIRVLHSVCYMNRGGIETNLMNYYRNIDRTKVQFDFLCNAPYEGAYDEEIRSLGGRIFRTPGFSPLKRFAYMQYMKNLFTEHPEYKIVEAHQDGVGAFALEAAKKANVPVRIYHAHSTGFPLDVKLPIKFYCKQMISKWSTHYFSCGHKAAEYFFTNDIVKKNDFTILHNAIDINQFVYNPHARENIRSSYNIGNKFVIGHVGRFAKVKNHSRIINIFAEVKKINPDVVLMLIGKGELYNSIQQKVNKLGLNNDVIFIGEVATPGQFYQAFDLFLMPSLYEGLPVVGIEAQASGLPCVFSSSITKEIGLSDNCRFIDLRSSDKEWAQTIVEVLLQKNKRSDNCRFLTHMGYDILVEAEKLQNMYISFAKKHTHI